MHTRPPPSPSEALYDTIHVRPMQDTEAPAVRAQAHQAFRNLFERIVFDLSPHTLVAERDGTLLGAIVLKIRTLRGRQMGEISWLFTAPAARGIGAGQHLVDAGLDYLATQGVDTIYTFVEGDNTSSSKQFTNRGFVRLSLLAQLQRFGAALPLLWMRSGFAFAYGHFLYVRPATAPVSTPWSHWLYVAGFHALMLALVFRLQVDLRFYLQAVLALVVVLIVRGLAMLGTAHWLGLRAEFRAWEAGGLISLLVALVGGLWILPGSVYPISDQWRYRDERRRLGIMSFVGGLVVVLALWSLLPLRTLAPDLRAVAVAPYLALAIVDVGLPFLRSYNGYRVWQWSRLAWLPLAAGLAAYIGWIVTG